MVELLVGGRPDLDVNIVEANSCSALMIACMHGYIQVMLLYEAGSGIFPKSETKMRQNPYLALFCYMYKSINLDLVEFMWA